MTPPAQARGEISGGVFANSLPKSGTHLLLRALEAMGLREHFQPGTEEARPEAAGEGRLPLFLNHREVKAALAHLPGGSLPDARGAISIGTLVLQHLRPEVVRGWMLALRPGHYLMGHVPWSPALPPVLAEAGVSHVCILRDPRAVIVSLAHFVTHTRGMPSPHFLAPDVANLTMPQRLDFLWEGGWSSVAGAPTRPFAACYRDLLAWEGAPGCLVVRYEDLVGPRGGGSAARQRACIARIASHLGLEPPAAEVELYDQSSRTFRTAHVRGWEGELDPQTSSSLRERCRDLCDEAGYGD